MSTGTSKSTRAAAEATADSDTPPWEKNPAGDVSEVAPASAVNDLLNDSGEAAQGAQVDVWAGTTDDRGPSTTDQVRRLLDFLRDKAVATDDDSGRAMMDMIAQVMAAETAEEVLDTTGTTPAEEVLGIPMQILGARYHESDMASALPFYVVLEVFRGDTRTNDIVNCGGFKVVTQVARLDMLGQLTGRVVRIMKSERPTRQGNYPLHLEFAA